MALGREALVIAALDGAALSHWSLPAIERIDATPDDTPRYAPGRGAGESLEIADPAMIEAIERVRRAIARRRPRRRLWRRWLLRFGIVAAAAAAIVPLPDVLRRYAVRVAPPEVRTRIGEALAERLSARFGAPCDRPEGRAALDRLTRGLAPDLTPGRGMGNPTRVVILPEGPVDGAALPGAILVLPGSAVEEASDAGAVGARMTALAERSAAADPLDDLLRDAGAIEAARLLTTASISDEALDAYALRLAAPLAAQGAPDTGSPAGRVRAGGVAPSLPDAEWIALQGICDG